MERDDAILLWEANVGLAKALAREVITRRFVDHAIHDDIFQVSLIALWQAVVKFDPARGVPFRLYAKKVIFRRIELEISKARMIKGRPRRRFPIHEYDRPTAAKTEPDEVLARAIASVPGRWGEIFRMYYVDGLNYQEIARRLSITKQRVCQIVSASLDKVRRHYLGGGLHGGC